MLKIFSVFIFYLLFINIPNADSDKTERCHKNFSQKAPFFHIAKDGKPITDIVIP